MKELSRILVDNGRVVINFPFYEKEIIISQFEIWYTPERVQRLLDGWHILDTEFWVAEKKLFGR